MPNSVGLNDVYYLAAWWPRQQRSRLETAHRVCQFVNELAAVEARFADLHLMGNSFKRPVGPKLARDSEGAEKQLNFDRQVPNGGYCIYMTLPDESVVVNARDASTAPYLPPNSLFVRIEDDLASNAQDLLTVDFFQAAIEAVIQSHDPSFAVVTTSHYFERMGLKGGVPHVCWMLYLPEQISRMPRLPSSVECVPLADYGTIVMTTQQRFLASSEEHVALAVEATEELRSAGLLETTSRRLAGGE